MDVDSRYAKPFLTIPEQIHRMRTRGMDCGPDEDAAKILQRYGYYRLSGYSHPYRMRPVPPSAQFDADGHELRLDDFEPGTALTHVAGLYEFDQKLRTRVSDALSTIEVSFRFFIGHRLGRMDPFSHRKPEMMGAVHPPSTPPWMPFRRTPGAPRPRPTATYREWLEEYDRHETRAKDRFVLHFRSRYGPHLPIWVGTEVMSLGVLSNLYRLMPAVDQETLAARFQVAAKGGRGDSGALSNWLNNLRQVRNICAHYGRLWNRSFNVVIDAPGLEQARAQESEDSVTEAAGAFEHLAELLHAGVNNKLYGILLIMRHLMLSIDPDNRDVVGILDFIDTEATATGFDLADLGIPVGWRTAPVWGTDYRLPHEPMLAASLLDRAATLTQAEARELLTSAAPRASVEPRTPGQERSATAAARRTLLKDYRRYNTLIEISLAGVRHFPAFQFRHGAIIDPLAEINKTFLDANAGVSPLRAHAALLDWWQRPNGELKTSEGALRSPVEVLRASSDDDFQRIMSETAAAVSLTLEA
jgi:abortive infection bacteriophage resistance protein